MTAPKFYDRNGRLTAYGSTYVKDAMSLESVVLQAKAVTATWTPRVGFWAMVMPDGTVDYVDRKIGCIRHAEKHFGTRKVRFIRDA